MSARESLTPARVEETRARAETLALAWEQRTPDLITGAAVMADWGARIAREDVPALLAEIGRLTAALADEKAAHDRTRDEQRHATGWMPDALTAVREALDLPHAATVAGGRARQQVLEDRAMEIVIVLDALLEGPGYQPASTVAYLRSRIAERPAAGYVTSEQARAALDAGASWTEATTLPGGEL
ncbi:hypothetical protein [Kitasatospora sp. NBC_01266]|uniref:hypothetical protein n=1 Tax=Kitasatospora sp. NBC_01266 TaxID=2903572 RepID=UPI002E381789|nr:hypothetical protein [Kitasatospora sp. NBC_01266]